MNACSELVNLKNQMNNSGLTGGPPPALITKIDAALNALPASPKTAITQLQAFIDSLKNMKLDPALKKEYEEKAKKIMDALKSGNFICIK